MVVHGEPAQEMMLECSMLINIVVEQVPLAVAPYNGTAGLYRIIATAMKCVLIIIQYVKMFNAAQIQTVEQAAG